MSNPNCPFCGCQIAPFREKGDVIRYSCRNPLVPNSAPRGPLCREREAHNNTKRERDEAREVASGLAMQEERVNEAQKELSSIHRWIERNHPDGFIDSLTYFQNLDRITENWYDRLDRLEIDANRFERERDEAREALEFRRELYKVQEQCLETARRERDEARHKLELCMAANSDVARIAKERNEALDQVKELIYIAERAIALAEIDFENDKFGVVSELRDGVERIKEGAK